MAGVNKDINILKYSNIMETKFTKGKWVVAIDNTVHILSSTQRLNCRISQFVPKGRIDNSEANAKLIVAAPELLKMLMKISNIENHAFTLKGFDVERLKSEVNKVIKKATE